MMSIVMAYFDRRQLLINTLRSIEYYSKGYPVELIIVDDGSSEQINDINTIFPNLNINPIRIEKENWQWNNPCVAYNTGFNLVKGDVVMITCPECIHVGGIIEYIFKNFKPNNYWAFATYGGDETLNQYFTDFDWSEPEKITDLIKPDFKNGWRCHSTHPFRTLIPFCGIINRVDLEALSGFDERFIGGWGCADYDFAERIINLGLDALIIDKPFCVHQVHSTSKLCTEIANGRTDPNSVMLDALRRDFPKRIRAEFNKIYV